MWRASRSAIRRRCSFDALPDVKVAGKVARIDPKAKEGAGVNYTAVIQLDQIPDALRWGMTANADINASAASAQPANVAARCRERWRGATSTPRAKHCPPTKPC